MDIETKQEKEQSLLYKYLYQCIFINVHIYIYKKIYIIMKTIAYVEAIVYIIQNLHWWCSIPRTHIICLCALHLIGPNWVYFPPGVHQLTGLSLTLSNSIRAAIDRHFCIYIYSYFHGKTLSSSENIRNEWCYQKTIAIVTMANAFYFGLHKWCSKFRTQVTQFVRTTHVHHRNRALWTQTTQVKHWNTMTKSNEMASRYSTNVIFGMYQEICDFNNPQ